MVKIGNDLREKYGPSYLAESLYEIARKRNEDCIIESLRAPGEIEALRKKGRFYLFAVDAEPKIRYERILLRQGETDKVSFEEFKENEKREMESTDPNKQNLGKCILLADYKFDNNGTVGDLYQKVDKALNEIEKS
jgi:dephospho-CoA kinase